MIDNEKSSKRKSKKYVHFWDILSTYQLGRITEKPYIQKSRITNDRKSKRPNYQNACNIVWKVYAEYRKSRKNQDRKLKTPNYQKKYLQPNH